MKKLLFSLLFVFTLALVGHTRNTDMSVSLKDDGLNGPVKECVIKQYDLTDTGGEIKQVLFGKTVTTYDNKGNKVQIVNYKPDNSVLYRWNYKFDRKGNLMEYSLFNTDGSLQYKNSYKYDAKNLRSEERNFDGFINTRTAFKYDQQGRVVEAIKLNIDSTPVSRTTYQYDAKGNQSEERTYFPNGALISIISNTVDTNGNASIQNEYGPDSNIITRIMKKYDSNNRLVEEIVLNMGNTLAYKNVYSYDTNGNRMEKLVYDKLLNSRTTYKYDSFGNVTGESEYNISEEATGKEVLLLQIEYEYSYWK